MNKNSKQNKNRKTPQNEVSQTRLVKVTVPKCMQLFPSRLQAWGSIHVVTPAIGVTSLSNTFKMNGVHLFGPRTDFAGSFTTNAPAGLQYLLSANADTGALAPYGAVTVKRVEATIRVVSSTNNGTPNASPACIIVSFTPSPSRAGTANSILREQPFTTWRDVPAQTTAGAIVCQNSANCAQVFGVSDLVYDSDEDYWAFAGSDPNRLCYIQTALHPLDGVSTMYYMIEHQFKVLYEFHTQNNFASAAP